MSSDHHDARQKYLERTQLWIPRLVQLARVGGELKSSTDMDALSHHISFTIIGLLGLWASALMTGLELSVQFKKALAYAFYYHGSKSLQNDLKTFID